MWLCAAGLGFGWAICLLQSTLNAYMEMRKPFSSKLVRNVPLEQAHDILIYYFKDAKG